VRRADLLRVFLPAFGVDPGAVSQSLRAAATGSVAAPAALQGRVLVAEDYPLNQQVIRAVLELHGCEVTMAQNGREAVEAVQRESFDLVFMDCQMPELDGYMATRAIRALEQESGGQSRRTPIVALTAHATQADRERCLNAGMDSYVSKPFTQVVLLQELRRWLTGARHEATVPAVVSDFADTQRLDTRTLNELRSLDRNAPAETLRGFVQTYLAHTAVLLGRIGAALAAGDLASIESEAHKLKSGSLTMGAVRVGKLAQVLEQACHAGDASRSRALLAQIEAEFALAEKLLQAHVVETSVAA
jgi:CheY-like chemotaxis protein/HPt (histidine-containing phosphotransfer) domain-containing protein